MARARGILWARSILWPKVRSILWPGLVVFYGQG